MPLPRTSNWFYYNLIPAARTKVYLTASTCKAVAAFPGYISPLERKPTLAAFYCYPIALNHFKYFTRRSNPNIKTSTKIMVAPEGIFRK